METDLYGIINDAYFALFFLTQETNEETRKNVIEIVNERIRPGLLFLRQQALDGNPDTDGNLAPPGFSVAVANLVADLDEAVALCT